MQRHRPLGPQHGVPSQGAPASSLLYMVRPCRDLTALCLPFCLIRLLMGHCFISLPLPLKMPSCHENSILHGDPPPSSSYPAAPPAWSTAAAPRTAPVENTHHPNAHYSSKPISLSDVGCPVVFHLLESGALSLVRLLDLLHVAVQLLERPLRSHRPSLSRACGPLSVGRSTSQRMTSRDPSRRIEWRIIHFIASIPQHCAFQYVSEPALTN